MLFDMSLYKPTDLEIKIKKCYRDHGIHTPADLTIKNVSLAFDLDVEYYNGKPFADWIGSRGIVALHQKDELPVQRADFFHESGHCVLHVGDQRKLPSLFVDLQEAQSLRFQYYAALPYFMIADMTYNSHENLIHRLSESFVLPEDFVQQRVNQIFNRIQQERSDIEFKARLVPKSAPEIISFHDYSDETKRILYQLHQQVTKQKERYRVGY